MQQLTLSVDSQLNDVVFLLAIRSSNHIFLYLRRTLNIHMYLYNWIYLYVYLSISLYISKEDKIFIFYLFF
jgi:hypothetical protein